MTEVHRFWRAPVTVGTIATGDVDRENRVIRRFSVVEMGEARGHEQLIDGTTLDLVVQHGEGLGMGLKQRFGHPNMSGDAFGTFAGRARNFRREGQRVVADAHFSEAADPVLMEHLFKLAETDPSALGTSLDLNMTLEKRLNEDGTPQLDPEGKALLPLVRPTQLNGSDFVDTPAATSGLFSGTNVLLSAEATEYLDRFLSQPDAMERADAFWQRYKATRTREDAMEDKADNAGAAGAEEKKFMNWARKLWPGSEPPEERLMKDPGQRPSVLPEINVQATYPPLKKPRDEDDSEPGIREMMASQTALITQMTQQMEDMKAEKKAEQESAQAATLSKLTARIESLVPHTHLDVSGAEGMTKTVRAMLDAGAGVVAATAFVDSVDASLPTIEAQAKLSENVTFTPDGGGEQLTKKIDLRPFGVKENADGKLVSSDPRFALHLAKKLAPFEGDAQAQMDALSEEWQRPGQQGAIDGSSNRGTFESISRPGGEQ